MIFKIRLAGVLVLAFGLWPLAAQEEGNAPEAPAGLRTMDLAEPVGLPAALYFGWRFDDPDDGESQSAWQILVASSVEKLEADEGDLWDSGKVAGSTQNHVAYAGAELAADARYSWKVRVWDASGLASPYAEASFFGTGLLENADWDGAQWIRRENDEPDDYTLYRRNWDLPAKSIVRATAYLSGTHQYRLWLNGQLAGYGQAFHHPEFQYYRAFDLTPYLRAGAVNQVAVRTHWFGGGQGRPKNERGLLMKAVAHFADGTSAVLGTDGAWRQRRAPEWRLDMPQRNRGEGVGFVEHIDGREIRPDWLAADFDEAGWEAAQELGAPPQAPWTGSLRPELSRIVESEIAPVSFQITGEASYLVDFGKVYAGRPKIRFSGGQAGDVVKMRAGYALKEGRDEIDPAQDQSTDLRYFATLSGGDFVFEAEEYLGFRYLAFEGVPELQAEDVRLIHRHSELDAAASGFESPNDTLNAVWALMKHSLYTCAQEEFVDTPTREKGGFLGDAAIQSIVAMPVLGERKLTQRTMREFLDSMRQHWSAEELRGRMNAVYPNADGARDIPDYTQAYPLWVWRYYLETGDRAFLAEAYPYLQDIAAYVKRHLGSRGLVEKLTGGSGSYEFGIVDWPPNMRYGYDVETTANTVVNGWAYVDFHLLAGISRVLENEAEALAYAADAEKLRAALNAQLLSSGRYYDGLKASGELSSHASQHANIIPLAMGIVPEDARESVLEHVKSLDMRVGMITVSWLLRALGEEGEGAALVDLLTNPEQDGWARCLARGATATWEAWDADEVGHSQSHAWGAAGLEAYTRYLLGIFPTQPQYEEVRIAPVDCGEKLPWARGWLETERGRIEVAWERKVGSWEMEVRLPDNVRAHVSLPAGANASARVLLNDQEVEVEHRDGRIELAPLGSGTHVLKRLD
ncbi:MAG: family 78 glycoside hydrolase catalytic domain [Verrucomicrobiales bacterium]